MLILDMAGLNKVCSSPERIVPFGIAPHRVKITLGAKKKKWKLKKERHFGGQEICLRERTDFSREKASVRT